MTHSGHMQLERQSKQKYEISSSGCSRQKPLDALQFKLMKSKHIGTHLYGPVPTLSLKLLSNDFAADVSRDCSDERSMKSDAFWNGYLLFVEELMPIGCSGRLKVL